MRKTLSAIAVAMLLLPAAASAQTQNGSVVGFGGVTFGDTVSGGAFGGAADFALSQNVHVIGEVGRMNNLSSSLLDTVLSFTPIDVNLSAFYGEGGVRFISSPKSRVRGYADATAGMARLRPIYSGPEDAIVNTALRFLDRTEPTLGAGGGVLIQTGPVVLDLGYRYRKIFTDSAISLLSGDRSGIQVNQVRVGVGYSF